MSDSQPPVWGSAPWDARDPGPTLPDVVLTGQPPRPGEDVPAAGRLADEAVLSGAAGGLPGSARTAGAVIAALLAPARPDELDGESAALATFRMLTRPGPPPASTLSGPIPVRPLPARRADSGSHRRRNGGHRRPPRAAWPGRGRLTAVLAGVAAAVAGVVAVFLALSSAGPQPAVAGHPASATRSVQPSSPPATRAVVDGRATSVPSPKPTPTPTPTGPTTQQLCQTYQRGWWPSRRIWKDAVAQLSVVADGKWKIGAYCWTTLRAQPGGDGSGGQPEDGGHGGGGDYPGGGDGQDGQGDQGSH